MAISGSRFGNMAATFKFAVPYGKKAGVAQLVEHDLAKVGVASSSLVSRSESFSDLVIS
jgi:hypothetical protein